MSSANRWAIGEVKQVALPQQQERDTRLLPERVDEYLIGKKVTGYFAVNVIHYGYGESGPGTKRQFAAAQRCVCCQRKTRRSAATAKAAAGRPGQIGRVRLEGLNLLRRKLGIARPPTQAAYGPSALPL
jgi:hypothetical protein